MSDDHGNKPDAKDSTDPNLMTSLSENLASSNNTQELSNTTNTTSETTANSHLTRNENSFNQYMTQMARIEERKEKNWQNAQKELVGLHTELNKSVVDGEQVGSAQETATTALMLNMVKAGLSEATINAVCKCIDGCR